MRTLKSFCIVSVFLAITAYAQDETRYERGATVLENTLPAAPEASSVVKYTDVPVSYSSGRVQMSVPVWTLQGREINVPISLRYSSGGIKMEDIAGVAGLGWSLDAGGCIIRDITYLPDEFYGVPTGRFYTRPSSEQLSNLINQTDTSGTLAFLRNVLWNRCDPSPDRYSYSFCGLSGSFILTPDNEVVQLSGDGVVITFDSSNDIFRITGPDGTRYTFAAREIGTKESPYGPGTPTSGQNSTWTATTAWYLTQITSRTGLESAVFSYSSAGTWNKDSRVHSRTVSVTLGSGYIFPHEYLTSTFSTTLSSYQSLVLSSITLGDFQATFQYDTENSQTLLVSGSSAAWNFPRRLRRITVKGPGDAPSYLLHARELTRLEVFTDRDSYDGRILLDSLQVYRGGTLDDRWAFSYKRPFRRANRYSCDWYGYFNGECGDGDQFYPEGQTFPNRTDACPFKLEISSGGYLPKLSYGLPNDTYSDYLMLLESNHNGAVTGFEYEGNKMGGVMLYYYGSGTVTQIDTVSVGVRVKSITVSDGQGPVRKRRFRYGGPVATGPIVPLIGDYTTYDAIQSIESSGPGGLDNAIYTWSFTIHEHPSVSGASIQGTSLVYSRVQEDAYDPLAGESAGTARSVMIYGAAACAPVTHNVSSRFPSKWSNAYNQAESYINRFGAKENEYMEISPQEEAVLLRKEEYAWDSSRGHYLITTEENTYGSNTWTDVLTGYVVNHVMQPYTYGALAYSDMYHFPIWSHSTKGRSISSTERINYVQGTPIDTTVITYGHVLRTTLEMPSRVNFVSISGSDGDRTVQISYADNLAGLTNYGGVGGWADSLAAQHYLLSPIRRVFTRYERTPAQGEGGGNGSLPEPYLPVGISRTKTEALTAFAWFPSGTMGNSSILMPSVITELLDSALVWKEEIFSYDIMGRPTEIKERGRPRTAILWGYRGMHPLAAIENATLNDVAKAYSGSSNPQQGKILLDALSYANGPTNSQIATIEALRQALDSAHVSTFTYIPGIGAASISAPSGIKASYTYDGAGRLLSQKDTDGYDTEGYIYSLLDSGTGLLNIRKKTYTGPVQTSYFEDVSWWNTLGQLCQRTALSGGGSGEDLICAAEGDFMLHDDVRVWLPWPKALSGGSFIAAAADSSALWHGNATAYAAKGYEVSNRSRVLTWAQPGYDVFHRNASVKNSTKMQPFLLWQEPDRYHPSATTGIVDLGYYPEGEVAVESTINADGRRIAECRDRFGKTLSTQRSMDPGIINPQPKGVIPPFPSIEVLAPTNYIYDYKDRLRAVAGPGVAISDTLSMWRYSYDSLGRLSSKGIPGSIREYYTYDDEDRVISTGKGEDLVSTDYDAFGRPLAVWHSAAGSGGQMGQRRLMERHVYDSIPALSQILVSKADSLLGGGVLTLSVSEGTPPSYAGLLTWSEHAVLEGDDAVMAGGDSTATVNTARLYDHKGNPVVTVTEYPSGVISARRDSFNFIGEPYHSTTRIIRGYNYGVADSLKIDILDWQAGYDQRGRIVSEVSSLLLSGAVQAVSDTTLYSYDALGRPSGTASTASASAVGAGQTPKTISTQFAYNLRSQITSIQNKVGSHTLFSESLLYDTIGDTGYSPSYTGLVTERTLVWTDDRQPVPIPGSPAVTITYEEGYSYDAAERLKEYGGQWIRPKQWNSKNSGLRFTYDDRGNILSETAFNGLQTGVTRSYSYSGDKLESLSDNGGFTQTGFYHDSQGRMIYDGASDMEIAYNHLDLPKNISTGSDILVNYSYLANGAKLGALTPSGSGLVYIGPMVYFRDITGNLSFESTAVAAGRMTAAGLQYQLRDHLGSTVAVVTPAGASVEASNFAAFGERTSTPEEVILVSSSNQTDPVHLRHHFTGKEDQTMFGTGMPYIDFGARHYSAPLRRWLTPDPLSEKYYDTTPYAYCANNPVNFVDPEGKKAYIFYTENGMTKCFLFTGQETKIPNNSFVQNFVTAYKYNKENWEKAGYKGQEPTALLVEREEYVKVVFGGTVGNSFNEAYDNRLVWNPEAGMLNEKTGIILSPATGLAHEADHANGYFDNPEQYKKRVSKKNNTYEDEEEKRVIMGSEQKTAKANGEIKSGQVTRMDHFGVTVIVNGVTSTIINQQKTKLFNEQYKKDYWRAFSSE